jgi:hypothetical protein
MTKRTEDRPPLSAARAFVVQFRAVDKEKPDCLKGRVEHITSGRVQYFSSMEELSAFLEEVLNEP